jgi:hypothetical protein
MVKAGNRRAGHAPVQHNSSAAARPIARPR